MRILLVTYHHVSNYGSVLQAYASQRVLESFRHQVDILDYVSIANRDDRLLPAMVADSRFASASWPMRKLFEVVSAVDVKRSLVVFEHFRSRRLRLTKRVYSPEDIASSGLGAYDVYCTGSDQVWNPTTSKMNVGVDPVFFLRFAPSGVPKFSLSASFGVSQLAPDDASVICGYLRDYWGISVREATGKAMLETMGFSGVKNTIDPTVMLSAAEWRALSEPISVPRRYILVYQLHANKDLEAHARALGRALSVPVVRVAFFWRNFSSGEKIVYLPRPEQLLHLIMNASLVVTDSFHGTVLSTVLNTPFVCMYPDRCPSRLSDYLSLLDLGGRVAAHSEDLAPGMGEIDWDAVNRRLADLRTESLGWISEMLDRLQFRKGTLGSV